MADLNKFEKMLELLVNEDKAAAQELFHEIVVEKSRDIYESLLEADLEVDEADEDEDEDEVDEATDEEVDESDDDLEEDFNLDEFEVEADPMDMGDAGDDMLDAMGPEDEMDMGDEEGEEGDMEDRVEDLEDALEDLKAEFEKMMSDESDDEGEVDMDMDMDDEEEADDEMEAMESSDEEVDEAEEETEESAKSEAETMREYVEKVSAKMGDNGANTKSPVANANDMGGDASNLVAGGEAGTGGTQGGLANPSTKEENAGNVNVPGGKAAKSNKNMPKGHGAEKKGAGDTAANKKPVIGG